MILSFFFSGHSSIQKSHQYRLEKSPDNTFNDNSIDINTSKRRKNTMQYNNNNNSPGIQLKLCFN